MTARENEPEPEIFPLSLHEVAQQAIEHGGRSCCLAQQVYRREVEGLADRQLISPTRPGHSPRMAEYNDKRCGQQSQGIPIPGSTARSRGRQHRRSCGLDMDSDAVLEELAASEGGGFNRDWQLHGPSL